MIDVIPIPVGQVVGFVEPPGRDQRDDPVGQRGHLGRCQHNDVAIGTRKASGAHHLAPVVTFRTCAR